MKNLEVFLFTLYPYSLPVSAFGQNHFRPNVMMIPSCFSAAPILTLIFHLVYNIIILFIHKCPFLLDELRAVCMIDVDCI